MKRIKNLFLLSSLFLLFSCSQTYLGTLQKSGGYIRTGEDLKLECTINENRAKEIRDYFTEKTELNLNAINESSDSEWDKTIEIATFVSKNIHHANQKEPVEKYDAISLWEYHLNVEKNFNCKYHAMLTNELLLSVGIVNNYVWCMPKSEKDTDCHVINNVWNSEFSKWVMIDTDQCTYICDSTGTPLSIREIRQNLIDEDYANLKVSSFAKMSQSTSEYLNYLSKDFYWFTKIQKIRFRQDVEYEDKNHYVNLLPYGFSGFDLFDDDICTNDDEAFWCEKIEKKV